MLINEVLGNTLYFVMCHGKQILLCNVCNEQVVHETSTAHLQSSH